MRQGDILDTAAADVGMQDFHAAGGKFVGKNRPVITHPGGNLCCFRAGRGGNVHHAFRCVAFCEQGGNRQHRTGFLNIKQTAQMFCGTSQRHGIFVIALDPKPLCTPGHRRKLPVVGGNQRQKIIDADFQRVDANAPA